MKKFITFSFVLLLLLGSSYADDFVPEGEDDVTFSANNLTLDGDDAGGNIELQFGATLSESLQWDSGNARFSLSDDLDLGGNELEGARIENLAVSPTCDATVVGKIYHNTVSNNSYVCGGTLWEQIDGSTISIEDADGDTKIRVEAGVDEDVIRFDTLGVERMNIDNTGVLTFGSGEIKMNKGGGSVATGADIWFSSSGLISADSNLYFNIDGNNNTTSGYFQWNKDSESTTGDTELMKLDEDGDLDVLNHMAIGPNAGTPTSNVVLRFGDNSFAGNLDRNVYTSYLAQTLPTTTLTANRTSYGHYVLMNNNKGGTAVTGERSYASGMHSLVRNTAGNYAYSNTGGAFEGRSESTAGAAQVRGVSAIGRQYDATGDSNIDRVYGVDAQALGRSGTEGGTTTITNAKGLNALSYAYATDLTVADGVYAMARTNDGYDGVITNAYGVRGYVNSDSDAGQIVNGTAGHFHSYGKNTAPLMTISKGVYAEANDGVTGYALQAVADDIRATTNYGIQINAKNASGNNYGIYGLDGDWVLDADGDGVSGGVGSGGDLVLGEGQDLEIYHDGVNSYINNNTGDLYIGDVGTDDVILSNNGGNVGINNNNPQNKLDIESSGQVFELGDTTASDIKLNFDDGIDREFGWDDSETSFSTFNNELAFRTRQGVNPPVACSVTVAGMQWMDTDTGLLYICDTSNGRNKWLSTMESVLWGDETSTCAQGNNPDIGGNCNVDWGNGLGPDTNTSLGLYIPRDITITGYGFSSDNDGCTAGSFDVEVWGTGSNVDDNNYTLQTEVATGLTGEAHNANNLNLDLTGDQYILWGLDNNCTAGTMDDWAVILYYKNRHN